MQSNHETAWIMLWYNVNLSSNSRATRTETLGTMVCACHVHVRSEPRRSRIAHCVGRASCHVLRVERVAGPPPIPIRLVPLARARQRRRHLRDRAHPWDLAERMEFEDNRRARSRAVDLRRGATRHDLGRLRPSAILLCVESMLKGTSIGPGRVPWSWHGLISRTMPTWSVFVSKRNPPPRGPAIGTAA